MSARLLCLLAACVAVLQVACASARASAGGRDSKLSSPTLYYHNVSKTGYSVKYDDRSFIIDGKRTLLLSGAVHYPRSMPDEWSGIFREMIYDGMNMVQTYIYWNLHETVRGQKYDFSGNKNWTLFVEKAAEAGLFVTLRIGPFVASEWDYGAIPYWINSIPGMVVRSNNDPWKKEMSRFFTDIVNMARPYLAVNGGPIILGQVENEYHWNDMDYVNWCGDLVKETNPGVPFLMCNGLSANNTVNTCNGDDCAKSYVPTHAAKYPGQPLAWTENEGWFEAWNEKPLIPGFDNRSPEDMAYVVMKWFARGASHHNYYMWYGGNNFGRWAGACITTMYCNGVNFHSDFLPFEPKRTHLQKLYLLLNRYGNVLLNCPSQVNSSQPVLVYNATSGKFENGTDQFAYIYRSGDEGIAFVENDASDAVLVQFMSKNFTLPPSSSSLIEINSVYEMFNSGTVSTKGLRTERIYKSLVQKFNWKAWKENVNDLSGGVVHESPLEQLSLTKDLSDYLFYQTVITGKKSGLSSLKIESRISNSFIAFIDETQQSTTEECKHDEGPYNYSLNVETELGKVHNLTLLSVSLGISTHTEPGEFDLKGIVGQVSLDSEDITGGKWLHRPKLTGEIKNVFTPQGSKNVSWDPEWQLYVNRAVVWFQYTFDQFKVDPGYSLLLDLQGMGRGYIYLNGVNLGRYWLVEIGGSYVQQYYYIPQYVLQSKDNILTLIEEIGAGAPNMVQFVESTVVVPS